MGGEIPHPQGSFFLRFNAMQTQAFKRTFQRPHSAAETKNIILLHGLFGTLSNWENVQKEFGSRFRIFAPELPLLNSHRSDSRLGELVVFLEKYISDNGINKPVLIGNSLGGHIALLYTLRHPDQVNQLILTGSSGLYEKSFNHSFPRVKDYDYIESKVKAVFHRKEVVKKELVDRVYSTVQNTNSVISFIGLAKEAKSQNLAAELKRINLPVLLIWGLQDTVTPPSVAHEFYERLPSARLCLINDCGHVPMMEQPELFNKHLNDFLEKKPTCSLVPDKNNQ